MTPGGGGFRRRVDDPLSKASPRPTEVARSARSAAAREDIALALLAALVLLVSSRWRAVPPAPIVVEGEAARALRIDVRTAPWFEWTLLDGIGESRARAIVAYREAHGPFRSLEDLARIPGLPRGWLEKARPHLKVGSGRSANAEIENDRDGLDNDDATPAR